MILLHGFAMTPEDLSPFAHSLGLPAWFLFPEGPIAAKPDGRAWWHIDPGERERSLACGPRDFCDRHPPDLPAARARLCAFVEEIARTFDRGPLVVGGFSQGGMLACDTLLRESPPVDAALALSSSRIAFDEWAPYIEAGALKDLPILLSHGRRDPDLAFGAGVALRECLRSAGAITTWVEFDQGHEIPLVVWRAVRKFLRARMPEGLVSV